MQTFKAVLLDDEKHCLKTLHHIISESFPEIEVVGLFHNPMQFLESVPDTNFDLLFIDIKMPHLTGFEVLDRLDNKEDFKVVITTAYDKFAINAIQYTAFDYLLKPISEEDLRKTMKRLRKVQPKMLDERKEVLDGYVNISNPNLNRIALPTAEGYEFVEINEITRCEADRNYAKIHQNNGEVILISRPLKELEQLLDGGQFIRVHNSHLVNKQEIKKYLKSDGGQLLLKNGDVLPISRLRKDGVLELLFSS